jgi:hypothetical protein
LLQCKSAPEDGTVCRRNHRDFVTKLLQYDGKAPEDVGQPPGLSERRDFRRDQGNFHGSQLWVKIGEWFESEKVLSVPVHVKIARLCNVTSGTALVGDDQRRSNSSQLLLAILSQSVADVADGLQQL